MFPFFIFIPISARASRNGTVDIDVEIPPIETRTSNIFRWSLVILLVSSSLSFLAFMASATLAIANDSIFPAVLFSVITLAMAGMCTMLIMMLVLPPYQPCKRKPVRKISIVLIRWTVAALFAATLVWLVPQAYSWAQALVEEWQYSQHAYRFDWSMFFLELVGWHIMPAAIATAIWAATLLVTRPYKR